MGLQKQIFWTYNHPVELPVRRTAKLPTLLNEMIPNQLKADLDTIPRKKYDRAARISWQAYFRYAELTKNMGGPHLSKTHTLRDMGVHMVLITWNIDD